MAFIEPRSRKGGEVSYVVRWYAGGSRDGERQWEFFDAEDAAIRFKDLVKGYGEQWPPGWIKGQGFVADVRPQDEMFEAFAFKVIDKRAAAQDDTKAKYKKLVTDNMSPWFKHLTVREGEGSITSGMVQDWVNDLSSGALAPHDPKDRKPRTKFKSKTVRNQHGLLHSILQAAVDAEPSLRETNPCANSSLPRPDADQTEDDTTFLEREEFGWIFECIAEDAKDLAEGFAETGARWGELTALWPKDLIRRNGRPAIRISRAWKHDGDGKPILGAPKTRRSRRTIVITERYWQKLKLRARGKKQNELLFTGPEGGRWDPGTFRRLRWVPAIEKAAELYGLFKQPRIHDIRHSHASWLIAAKVPLPAIQARLGHESITTTVDRYGHLLDALDGEVIAAIEWAMNPSAPLPGFLRETGLAELGNDLRGQYQALMDEGWTDSSPALPAAEASGRNVYALTLRGRTHLFADRNVAQQVAWQWDDDHAAEIAMLRAEGRSDEAIRARGAVGPVECPRPAGTGTVWTRLPDRQFVYSATAAYHPDGSLAYEPLAMAGRWVWEFEAERFTIRGAQYRREVRPHGGTEIQVRGVIRAAVEHTFEQVCFEGAMSS
ncbi:MULTISPECIES: site-specific integrase [Streptacidiphilus]|uniref:Tyrosine-type recombinase/integrase n=1 Tax=Streptacidiphilus cavernicola TaxID=3342716 RepID=A0ABV6UNY6_9ACTN|nr:site-specific integrase [Streptacidiphilus jeojiense]